MARPRRSTATVSATTLRLKPADPFELIRWLARSQSDPPVGGVPWPIGEALEGGGRSAVAAAWAASERAA